MKKEIVKREIFRTLQKKRFNYRKLSLNRIISIIDNIRIGKDLDNGRISTEDLAENIKQYGITEIAKSLKEFCRFCGIDYSLSDIKEFLRPYENKKVNDYLNDSLFHKNQIGSMYELILEYRPQNIKEWRKILKEHSGEKIKKQTEALKEVVFSLVQEFAIINVDSARIPTFTKFLKGKVNDHLYKENIANSNRIALGFVDHFIVYKTFFGLSLQIGVAEFLHKELKFSYELASDKEDSKGIDAYIDGIPVQVKKNSYFGSAGGRHNNKGILIITYKIEGDEIIINYEQLMIDRKERKLRASI